VKACELERRYGDIASVSAAEVSALVELAQVLVSVVKSFVAWTDFIERWIAAQSQSASTSRENRHHSIEIQNIGDECPILHLVRRMPCRSPTPEFLLGRESRW
jgi:hypothetical protein